jgi:hypothetical protein
MISAQQAAPAFGRIRQALADQGFVPAMGSAESSGGRTEEATLRPARLIESDGRWHRPVGESETWDVPVAFLDGIQRSEVVGYVGTSPIVVARVAAAVRERRDRRLVTVAELRRNIVVGRADPLNRAAGALAGLESYPLDEDVPAHPVRELLEISRLIDRVRGNLELEVGDLYRLGRRPGNGWLVVDGALGVSPAWADDPRMLGVSKSHSTLPFEGAELEQYLRLPVGHRSPLFAPSGRYAPVHAWALRLWPWEGKDIFHGLIRIEVSPEAGTSSQADRLSRFLLAERAPVSTPDPRWDRLLYGIHGVEEYLKRSG